MSNQRTTQLRKLLSGEVAPGDLIPIIDVSALESGPTGETKAITAQNIGSWIANNSVPVSDKYQANQTSNGLWFNENVAPNGDLNKYCYAPYPALGSNFSLYVRGFVPSDFTSVNNDRVMFGVGPNVGAIQTLAGGCAFIGVNGTDLFGYVDNGMVSDRVTVTGFFDSVNPNKTFGALFTKNSSGVLSLYVNGVLAASASSGPTTGISNAYLVMGCGETGPTAYNVGCTIYEAHVFSSALDATSSLQLFYGGANVSTPSIISSYTSENLNPGPTQWLDSVGSNHLLLPTVGASATSPTKTFTLNFRVNSSGFLGDGTERDILPDKYILTSCVVESDYKPLLCVGTSSSLAPVSASGTGSWVDNRVPYTSASYGVNPLALISLGVAHPDKSIYVNFTGSGAFPCTFSFEGYVRN